MIKKLLKNPSFMIGFLFLFILLVTSLLYPGLIKPHLDPPPELIYEDGNLVDQPPYPPSLKYPFGVDRLGQDTFWNVIEGAKYTLLIAAFIGLLRMFLGMGTGVLYGLYHQRFKMAVEPLTRAFRFIPTILIAMMFFVSEGGIDVIFKQCLMLSLITFLPLTSVIGDELRYYLKNEFIDASRLLGGSKWWIVKVHIRHHLQPRMIVILLQQIAQSLVLLVQLGAFLFVIGGYEIVDLSAPMSDPFNVASSLSHEWSGMIGLSYNELRYNKWIVLGPSLGFVLSLFALNLMLRGIQSVLTDRSLIKKTDEQIQSIIIEEDGFKLVNTINKHI
jgi:peptide/nickel transport system permease protein